MAQSQKSTDLVMRIDGGARGNPGPAAYGVVVEAPDGSRLDAFSETTGRATNNVAEYRALVRALEYAVERGAGRVKVFSDSELLVRQMLGTYKVRHPDLKPLHARAQELIARLGAFRIEHVRREENREADRLVNAALDGRASGAKTPASKEALHAEAKYEDGVLKLRQPLPLDEGEEVDLQIRRKG